MQGSEKKPRKLRNINLFLFVALCLLEEQLLATGQVSCIHTIEKVMVQIYKFVLCAYIFSELFCKHNINLLKLLQ